MDYNRALLSVLHGHHLTEDEIAFPYFRDKLPGAPFDQLVAEHQEMESYLEQAEVALGSADSDSDNRRALSELGRALEGLQDLWARHIATEETYLSAQAAEALMDADEQHRVGGKMAQHAQQNSGPDYLVVPFLLYNLEPEDRAVMEKAMPPIVTQQLVPVAWAEQWAPMKHFLLD